MHYTAQMTLVVPDIPGAIAAAQVTATARGGDVLSQHARNDRDGSLHLKVAADQLEAALDDLVALGHPRRRSIEGIDITEAFADTEARIAIMRAARDRLMALYERATSVTEILAIQEHLDRLQEDLDATEARMRVLRNQRDLADIHVNFERQRILGPLGLALKAIGWTLEKLFVIQ